MVSLAMKSDCFPILVSQSGRKVMEVMVVAPCYLYRKVHQLVDEEGKFLEGFGDASSTEA